MTVFAGFVTHSATPSARPRVRWGRGGRGDGVPGIANVDLLSTGPSTVALLIDGALTTWGGNLEGELGIGSAFGHLGTPSSVDIDSVVSLSLSSSGSQSSVLAVHADGSMSAWGWNAYDQLGSGKTSNSEYSPVAVVVP